MTSTIHPIEAESYRILAARVDLSRWPAGAREVVARVIHATADLEYATTMVVDEAAVRAGVGALRAGAPIVADVEMTARGITGRRAVSYLDVPAAAGSTRSASAIRAGAREHPRGAVFVIGCAPTALDALCDLIDTGAVEPALVIGLPVGFVGAAAAKERLRATPVPAISNIGDKGGSAAAAAAANALGRLV